MGRSISPSIPCSSYDARYEYLGSKCPSGENVVLSSTFTRPRPPNPARLALRLPDPYSARINLPQYGLLPTSMGCCYGAVLTAPFPTSSLASELSLSSPSRSTVGATPAIASGLGVSLSSKLEGREDSASDEWCSPVSRATLRLSFPSMNLGDLVGREGAQLRMEPPMDLQNRARWTHKTIRPVRLDAEGGWDRESRRTQCR